MNKKIIKTMLLVLTLVILLNGICITAFAAGGSFLEEIDKYVDYDSAQQKAAETTAPVTNLFTYIIAVISTLFLFYFIVSFVFYLWKVHRGKEDFGKKTVGRKILTIVLLILVAGGSWRTILIAGEDKIIKPGIEIITEGTTSYTTPIPTVGGSQ